MLTLLIKEIDLVIQDDKLPVIVSIGCISAAFFNVIQFSQGTALSYELRALQCIAITIGLLVCSTIKNSLVKGQILRRRWGYGGLAIAAMIGVAKIYLPK